MNKSYFMKKTLLGYYSVYMTKEGETSSEWLATFRYGIDAEAYMIENSKPLKAR